MKKPVEVIERMRSKFVVSESDWRELLAYLDSIKAERDRLKAHAEAMANGVEGKVYYADAPDVCEAVDAYRRDFPRTP